jgi:hypothetical protein
MRCKLTTDGKTAPALTDGIAFAENAVSNLFSNAYFYVGSTDISSSVQFLPQANSLFVRMTKESNWYNSLGQAYNFGSLEDRIQAVSSTTSGGLGENEIDIIWQPPLGIFHTPQVLMTGQYKISLQPKLSNVGMVQSTTPKVYGTEATVDVLDFRFYLWTFRSDSVISDGTFYYDLKEINIMTKAITNDAGENNFQFTVPSSTLGLAVWAQSNAQGSNTQFPPSYFACADNKERNLRQLQIMYSNQAKPTFNYGSVYSATQNGLHQRYIDTETNNGLIDTSSETYTDWLKERGPYFYWAFVRDASDKSTEVQISVSYESITNAQIFLASVYRQLIKVSVSNSMISSVQKVQM